MYKYFPVEIIFRSTVKVYSAYKSTLIFERKFYCSSTYTPENTVLHLVGHNKHVFVHVEN